MKKISIKLLSYVFLVAFIGFWSQIFAEGGAIFTNRSLIGTYYIPCASEGTYHISGMGKVNFDGHDSATVTQYQVYTEVDGAITRAVIDGVMQLPPYVGVEAKRTGTYTVNREGFGEIQWDSPPGTATFMITEAQADRATAVYMIIDDAFPGVVIHVEARKR